MIQLFVGRRRELDFLEKNYAEKKFGLIVIYGRKRIGKTELIKNFVKNKPHIYFLADSRGDYQNLKEVQRFMGNFLGDNLFIRKEYFAVFGKSFSKKSEDCLCFDLKDLGK